MNFRATLSFITLATLVVGCNVTQALQQESADTAEATRRKEVVDEVWQLFDRTYVDQTFNQQDWMEVRQEYLERTYPSDQALYDALHEMVGLLDDPGAQFIPPEEFRTLLADPGDASARTDLRLDEGQPTQYRVEAIDGADIGYIRVTQFGGYTPDELETAIADLDSQGVSGYVLDLRSNPGGLLNSAVDAAQLWLQDGLIVSLHSRGTVRNAEADGRSLTDKPLAVLVNADSANASELLASALQGQQRAILVGTPTYGENIVRSIRPLAYGAGLMMPTAKWYPPGGQDISGSGLEPDVVVELSEAEQQRLAEEQRLGTAADPQFVAAVRALMNWQVR